MKTHAKKNFSLQAKRHRCATAVLADMAVLPHAKHAPAESEFHFPQLGKILRRDIEI